VVSRGLITSGNLLLEVLQVFIAIQGGKFLYTVVGVRFKKAGKIYYFDPLDFPVEREQSVIVETARGIEYGKVRWQEGG